MSGPAPKIAPDLMDRLRARFEPHPLHQYLGIEFVALEPDLCTVAIELTPQVDNGSGTIHGGILAILADTAIAGALATNFDGKMGFATANLTIHYLHRARSRVEATARIVRKGSRLCVGQVEIHDREGTLVAVCVSDYILTTSRLES